MNSKITALEHEEGHEESEVQNDKTQNNHNKLNSAQKKLIKRSTDIKRFFICV